MIMVSMLGVIRSSLARRSMMVLRESTPMTALGPTSSVKLRLKPLAYRLCRRMLTFV